MRLSSLHHNRYSNQQEKNQITLLVLVDRFFSVVVAVVVVAGVASALVFVVGVVEAALVKAPAMADAVAVFSASDARLLSKLVFVVPTLVEVILVRGRVFFECVFQVSVQETARVLTLLVVLVSEFAVT